MAAVYLAIQESLDRPVALKVLTDPDSPEFSERFVNEGRIIASLVHGNIVTVHDVGIAEGLHYISMEYVDGGDLRTRIADGQSPEAALDLAARMADCLGFAHRKGVIHRDLKPANILFRRDGTPLLTDFGIAKNQRLDSDLTATGKIVGTPRYMSPEQALGKPVDGRSDLYSLGVVLYEMLTGEPPYMRGLGGRHHPQAPQRPGSGAAGRVPALPAVAGPHARQGPGGALRRRRRAPRVPRRAGEWWPAGLAQADIVTTAPGSGLDTPRLGRGFRRGSPFFPIHPGSVGAVRGRDRGGVGAGHRFPAG